MAERPSTIDVTASRREFTLAGNTYYIRPLDDEGYAEFERWVQDQVIGVRVRNADKLTDPDDRQRQIDRAFEQAASITIQSPEALSLMYSVEGATKLVYLYLRRDNTVTEDDIRKLMTDPKVIEEAMAGIEFTEGSNAGEGDPKESTKKG